MSVIKKASSEDEEYQMKLLQVNTWIKEFNTRIPAQIANPRSSPDLVLRSLNDPRYTDDDIARAERDLDKSIAFMKKHRDSCAQLAEAFGNTSVRQHHLGPFVTAGWTAPCGIPVATPVPAKFVTKIAEEMTECCETSIKCLAQMRNENRAGKIAIIARMDRDVAGVASLAAGTICDHHQAFTKQSTGELCLIALKERNAARDAYDISAWIRAQADFEMNRNLSAAQHPEFFTKLDARGSQASSPRRQRSFFRPPLCTR